MPELPEVETIRQTLEPVLLNQVIDAVEVKQTHLRWKVNPKDFDRWVIGQRILSLQRRAKYLLWQLQNDSAVVIHLGMSGRLGIFLPQDELEPHTHVIFNLANQKQIRYRDPRRFGFIEVVAPHRLATYKRFQALGPEPLTDAFNADYFAQKIAGRKSAIKNVLMDASVVVGLGNIYANEALFMAAIKPQRFAQTLSKDEIERLVAAVKAVLQNAITRGGTTLRDFRDARGEPGFFSLELSVYGREREACPNCGSLIEKMKISGRSSFYCPQCQR